MFMSNRVTMTECYKSLKKYGVNYYNQLLEFHNVDFDIRKISLKEIASFLTDNEKNTLSKYDNKWTFNLFLRCLERFIKSKKNIEKVPKFRSSNSVFKVKFTGMTN